MALRLEQNWLWDFWHIWHGDDCHLFYLQAPRSLRSEQLRHHHASIGHALSRDLRQWTVVEDALYPGQEGEWDDLATWTGSVIRHADRWYMFYTGIKRSERGLIERVGVASSSDLYGWSKHPGNPILEADPRWYEVLDLASWYEQAWRDPWVFQDPTDASFHALITARVRSGDPDGRGVIGHARSSNLREWEVLPPLTESGDVGQLELPQLVEIANRYFLLFSCARKDIARSRIVHLTSPPNTGTFCVASDNALGPFDRPDEKSLLVGDANGSYYGGRLIVDRAAQLHFLAWKQYGGNGDFVGELTDPFPVTFDDDGRLRVELPSVGRASTREGWL
jgi:beta-fructofuranosidase